MNKKFPKLPRAAPPDFKPVSVTPETTIPSPNLYRLQDGDRYIIHQSGHITGEAIHLEILDGERWVEMSKVVFQKNKPS